MTNDPSGNRAAREAPEPASRETRRLAAIVFVDMTGYSRQMSREEPEALRRRGLLESTVRTCAATHEARFVKSLGDGLMLEFTSAVDAVRCALQIQKELAEREEPNAVGSPLRVRIGIHSGDVVEVDGDVYGHAVNVAARLEKMAPPGGICLTREVCAQVRPVLSLTCEPVPVEAHHDLPEPLEVFRIASDRVPLPARADAASPPARSPDLGAERMTLAMAQDLPLDPDEALFPRAFGIAACLAVAAGVLLSLAQWAGTSANWLVLASLLRTFGGMASTGAILILGWAALRGGFGPIARKLDFWVHGPSDLDAEVLQKCQELGDAADSLADPMDRILTSYVRMIRVVRQDGWPDSGMPMARYTKGARAQLLILLERARRLNAVAPAAERSAAGGAAGAAFGVVAQGYRSGCASLLLAADVFERAEATVAQAWLATSIREPGAGVHSSLREMDATFEALREVVEASGGVPAAELSPTPAVEVRGAASDPAADPMTNPVRVGRSGSRSED